MYVGGSTSFPNIVCVMLCDEVDWIIDNEIDCWASGNREGIYPPFSHEAAELVIEAGLEIQRELARRCRLLARDVDPVEE